MLVRSLVFLASINSFGCLFGVTVSQADSRQRIEAVVASVGSSPILLSDMTEFRRKLGQEGLVDESLLRLTEADLLKKNDAALIEHLIREHLVDMEVKNQNLQVTYEKVEEEIRNITNRNGISRSQLESALKARGVMFSDYQGFIKTSLERQMLIDRMVSSKINITDDDIVTYLTQTSAGRSNEVFQYTISHILFVPKNNDWPAARKRAQNVRELLNGPVSFDSLAEQYSEDPSFSPGGALGSFREGEMLPEINRVVAQLRVGDLSDIIKTGRGYHIFKLQNKTLIPDPKFKEEQAQIGQILFAKAFQEQFRSYVNGLKEHYPVTVYLKK